MHSDLAFAAFDGFERELLDLLPAAVCICEAPSGAITHYNRRAAELWGAYPNPGEACYCGCAGLYIGGERVAHADSPMARVLRTGISVRRLELELERPDGSRIDVVSDIEPLRDRAGRVVRAINVFQDITERKRTEDLRARERRLLQQIAAGAPLAEILESLTFLVDRSTESGLASILLLDPDGIHLWPAAAPKLPTAWLEAISPVRIGANVGSCGTAAYRKDMVITHDIASDPLWADYRDLALRCGLRACWSSPIVAADGRLLGTFAIYYHEPHTPGRQEIEAVRFITGTAAIALERRRNEEQIKESAGALRNQQRWLQAVLDLMPMPTLFIEPGSGRVTFANRAANEMAGGHFPTGCPVDLYDVYYCTDAQGRRIPNHDLPGARLARGERLEAFEMNWHTPSGERPLIIFGDTLPAMHGHPAMAVVMFEDITRMKRTEEALRQAQKMESLGVLAGGIAHDFNNLLVAIMGNASLVLEDMADDNASLHLMQNVLRASQRAAELTRQMLAYSGQGRFVVQQLDLSQEVLEIGSLIQTSIPKSVTLELNLPSDIPAVLADSSQLQQVIMNLIINGAEAIGEERTGVITVTTGTEEVEPGAAPRHWLPADLPSGRYVFLEVRDTGEGMDESVKSRIFDPFFTTKFTGRGLGLAAVLGIVRGHNGAVQVESAPGAGTTVKVLFPAAAAEAANERGGEAPQEDLTGAGLILVIDDEESVAETARAALEHYGYTVLVARSGAEAEELFRTGDGGRISLVLLDMTMPVLSGEETLRRLQAIRPGVPVILSSGYGEQHANRRFHGKRIAGFLQKPYSAAALAACVKRVLGGLEKTQVA